MPARAAVVSRVGRQRDPGGAQQRPHDAQQRGRQMSDAPKSPGPEPEKQRDDLSDLEDGAASPGATPPLAEASPPHGRSSADRQTDDTSTAAAAPTGFFKQRTMKGFEWMKEKTTAAAAMVGEVAKNTGETIKQKDWTKEKQTWETVKTGTSKAMHDISQHTAAGAQVVMKQASATAQKIGLSGGASIEARCKQESGTTPCPRLLLVCCNAIAAGSLEQEGIFTADGPDDLVDLLYSLLTRGDGVVLIPKGTSPTTIAAVVKKYLKSLPEPLLTFKLIDAFVMAGYNTPQAAPLLQQLPSVSYNSLALLLDCARRVVERSEANKSSSRAIAEALAPCLLWHPPSKDNKQDAPVAADTQGAQLGINESQIITDEESRAIANVLEHLIDSQG